jgi:hypothetical protein
LEFSRRKVKILGTNYSHTQILEEKLGKQKLSLSYVLWIF